jgi:circadian clock protein KaiC
MANSRRGRQAATGIAGLDEVLYGGLQRERIYLIEGHPGAGKTTLALQFLLRGAADGERCLYITLSETAEEIRAVADSHGWNLEGLTLIELSALEQTQMLEQQNTLFEASEVELQETTRRLLDHVDKVQAQRVVLDSLSELRLMAQGSLRYRRQILGLKQHFNGHNCLVLLLDDLSGDGDSQVQSLAHGVLHLEQEAPLYGEDRRRLRVVKLRGQAFRGGYHDFAIQTGGIRVFPRLRALEHGAEFSREPVSSDVPELDTLLNGGLEPGTSTLITGPAGAGKSVIATQFALAVAARGEKSALLCFDESVGTLITRSRSLGLPIDEHLASEQLTAAQVDPAELGPGEFAHKTKELVEHGVRLLVIDSLNGYLNSMPDDRLLTVQMHELLSFLGQRGVTTIIVMAQHGLLGNMVAPVDVSYLADTVLLLRYFEAEGRIRKAISVVKKRSGPHEDTIRELSLGQRGIRVGPPLVSFSGVLTGVPRYLGQPSALSGKD